MASEAEIRAALAWETDTRPPTEKNTLEWLWEAIQGDFNEDRSTGQIAFDAAISMIPVVDQICDLRDLIANSTQIAQSAEGDDNTWKWVALALTLIGLFPVLGSLVKGVLKIFFTFVRRHGIDHLTKAVDEAMTWVITYLRKPEVQDHLRQLKVDEVFEWLADAVQEVRARVTVEQLLATFDTGIAALRQLTAKVAWIPRIGARARRTVANVEAVRQRAEEGFSAVIALIHRQLDVFIHKLRMAHMMRRAGIVDVRSVHFRGTLPETRAVTLMRTADPLPPWLSKGQTGKWAEQRLEAGKRLLAKHPEWPSLNDKNIRSFHRMTAVEIRGPARLYRVTSPSNGAMSDCWVPEDVWEKILAAPDPKAAWRRYCGVWPDWNPNGQFVVLEVKPGETLRAWRGPAASQVKDKNLNLDAHLEGGWDQVIIKADVAHLDSTRYYARAGNGEALLPPGLTRAEWERLSPAERSAYTPIREQINHPGIRGPLDTGWGATDFDAQLNDARIGLPALPGQITN